jgi:hypothetical protein
MILGEAIMNENETRKALEAVRKDANDPTLTVGDRVFCGGVYATVTEIFRHAPGTHEASPIRNDYTAVQVVTDNGTRWHGVTPGPESYGTIWVCQDCMLHHANGECGSCYDDDRGHDREPLSAIGDGFHVAMGMTLSEHAEGCLWRELATRSPRTGDPALDNYECDCETNSYSTSQCEGCGSYLHGERHAMTLFGPELQQWERDLLANN